MTPPIKALLIALSALVVLMVVATAVYIRTVFPGQLSLISLVEGAYYSIQTVTTVGYGNWTSDYAIMSTETIHAMKAWSLLFMLSGATLFGFIIGVAANVVSKLS